MATAKQADSATKNRSPITASDRLVLKQLVSKEISALNDAASNTQVTSLADMAKQVEEYNRLTALEAKLAA